MGLIAKTQKISRKVAVTNSMHVTPEGRCQGAIAIRTLDQSSLPEKCGGHEVRLLKTGKLKSES